MKNIVILSTFVVLLAAFYYAIVPSETVMLGSLRNSTQPDTIYDPEWKNDYVELSHGKTHYYILGPENGRRIVFVHGMGSPPPLLKPFLEKLANKGYRILAYDLYGRGYSDSPAVKPSHRIDAQVAVGKDFGGLISTGFATRFPELVEGIGYIAPAGLMRGLPPIAVILKVPVLGNLFLHLFGKQIITYLSTNSHKPQFMHLDDVEWYNTLQRFHIMNNPGFLRAFGSTVLNVNWGGYAERYKSLEKTHKGKVFAVWGELDEVVPTVLHLELQDLIPSAKIVVLKDYSHSIPIENSQLVADELHDFYKTVKVGDEKGIKGWFRV